LKLGRFGYRDKIREIAAHRGIDCLFHFTPAPNVPGIIEHGLLCRTHLSTVGLSAYTSIDHRLDGEDQAISVSISAINHKMFQAKRTASGRADWIVIILCASILWTHECRFYPRNAARREMLDHRGFLGGPWAFSEMFSQTSSPRGFTGVSYRMDTGIPDALTTYSDAEIQVLEPISPDYVVGAWTSDVPLAEIVQNSLNELDGPERDVLVRDFSPRFVNEFDAWG
jgi:hypothetical protein